MNPNVFITCTVTGAGDTAGRSPHVPVTPKQIAEAAVEAAQAGAAIAHIHVRDPETGKASRALPLYREVVQRVRDSGTDIILNLTAGMGGDIVFGSGEHPLPLDPAGTDMAALAGGNVRVGLEDNLWLDRGVLATNGALVERAATILTAMGATVMGPAATRDLLKLRSPA